MILSVLRSRLKPNIQDEYAPLSKRMSELAPTIAGYISHKGFVAEDGERITIVEFDSEEALERWRTHPEHVDAKRRGYREFYTFFSYQICSVMHARSWTARGEPMANSDASEIVARTPRTTGGQILGRIFRLRNLYRFNAF